MIIDIHAHTTNHKLWNLHTETATIADLERLAEEHGVTKIVLMATYFPFKGSGLHNEELLTRIGDRKLFVACGSLDMMGNVELGVMRLRRLAQEKRIVGIKLYPGYQDFKPSGVTAFPVYELAEEFNLPVILHSGYLHHCCSDASERRCGFADCPLDKLEYLSRPSQFFGAAQRFPRVKFVVAHLGNPHFSELRDLMRICPNVYTDISGTIEYAPEEKEALRAEIEHFITLVPNGVDRLMFATDFPIQSYADTIALVESLGGTIHPGPWACDDNMDAGDPWGIGDDGKANIYWKNATKLFRLEVNNASIEK